MIRVLGLNQHLALELRTPCAPCNLHQLGKQAFRRAPISGIECSVSTKRTDQRQLRKIVSLCQHLGADQDVRLSAVDK